MSSVFPYVCVHDWTPGNEKEPIIKRGDEGYRFATRVYHGQDQAQVSINSKPGFYAVPAVVINVSQVKAGKFSIRGLGAIIPQPSLPSGIMSESTLLDALLSGILHGLRTEMLSKLSVAMTAGIDSRSSCNKTKNAIIAGMPQDLVTLINTNR